MAKTQPDNGITIQEVSEVPVVKYGDTVVQYPYEKAVKELDKSANSWKPKSGATDEDRPWVSLRTGPRKRMDAFVARLKEFIIPGDGWVLQVTTRTLDGQSKIPYTKRTCEVFARYVPDTEE